MKTIFGWMFAAVTSCCFFSAYADENCGQENEEVVLVVEDQEEQEASAQ